MSLTALVKAIKQQESKSRHEEDLLLIDIAKLTDYETAEAAKDLYDHKKHAYGFEGYLYQLTKLRTVLIAGVPADTALECVDSCLDAETIINHYNSTRKGGLN